MGRRGGVTERGLWRGGKRLLTVVFTDQHNSKEPNINAYFHISGQTRDIEDNELAGIRLTALVRQYDIM